MMVVCHHVTRVLLVLSLLLSPLPALAQYTPQQEQALAYYAKHHPVYYQRYYGGLRQPAQAPAATTQSRARAASKMPLPSTAAPTTAAPTAAAPTTAVPAATTAAPTTAVPTTAVPTTAVPTTAVPTVPGAASTPLQSGPEPDRIAGMVEGESSETGDRTLSGHTFHYPRLIDNAFTATNFHVGTSVEFYHQGGVRTTFEQADGSVEELRYDRDLAFVRLHYGVDFQVIEAFTIGLDADYLVEVGANEESLFLHGGQTGYAFRPNFKWRIFRGVESGSQVSLRVHASLSGGVRAVPQGVLVELARQLDTIAGDEARARCLAEGALSCAFDGDTELGAAISVSQGRNGGGGTLTYAQALGQYAGFQVAGGGEAAKKTVVTPSLGDVVATDMAFHAGLSPSLNFAPGFPVGLTAEYRFDWQRSTYEANEMASIDSGAQATTTGHRWAAGVYYTGRRDLMLGWIAGISLLQDDVLTEDPMSEQPDALVPSAQFDMRYFF